MSQWWNFKWGKKGATPTAAAPVATAEEAAPAVAPAANAPAAVEAVVPPTRALSELSLPGVFSDALKAVLERGAHGLLVDPEEFSCLLCVIGDNTIETLGECPRDDYDAAYRGLQLLDKQCVALDTPDAMPHAVAIFNAVTDIGRRTVIGVFRTDSDAAANTERRKANVRLLNRLRPGTSLTRHNRERLLAVLARAGDRPPPSFVERLRAADLLGREAGDNLETVIRTAVLPRKAVTRVLGEYLGIPFVDVEDSLPRTHGRLLDRSQIIEWEAIPCGEEDGSLIVAMADPTDEEALARLRETLGKPVVPRVAAATDIRVAAEKLFRTA